MQKEQMSHVYGESFIVNGDDALRDFNVLFSSFSVISGRCAGNNERLCAMELRLRLGRFRLEAWLEPGNARSVGRRLTN